MERNELERLYMENGLEDFKLRTLEDLEKVHGINARENEGFATLDNANKEIFKDFIVNFFNCLGVESRAALVPKSIYYVEEINYLTKECSKDDYYIISGTVVNAIQEDGKKFEVHKWQDEDYKDYETIENETTNYLRFSYIHYKRSEWLHVKNADTWY